MPTSAERAYVHIRASILTGRYSSGSRLKENEIALELEISRTPVRDAIRRLHSDGLIEFEPNQGARVATWSEVDLDEISHMRALMESFAAGLAAIKISPGEIDNLRRYNDAMRQGLNAAEPNVEQISGANLDFHQCIVGASHNIRLKLIIEGLWILPLVTQKFALFDRVRLERSIAHHEEIIAALHSRDTQWASAIMRTHILAARAYDGMLVKTSVSEM